MYQKALAFTGRGLIPRRGEDAHVGQATRYQALIKEQEPSAGGRFMGDHFLCYRGTSL